MITTTLSTDTSLKDIIKKRMEQLEWNEYRLAIAYGKTLGDPLNRTDRELGNNYLTTIKKILAEPEKSKPETLRVLFKALQGELYYNVEFINKETHKISA